MDNCKDLCAMGSKHKQKEKKNFRNNGESNKDLYGLIEKKFQKFIKTKRRRKRRRSFSTFKKCRFEMTKAKRVSPAWQKVWKVEKSHPPVLHEI